MSTESLSNRQNYHQDTQVAVDRQINISISKSYILLSMYAYLKRTDVSNILGQKLVKKLHNDAVIETTQLIDYQLTRGAIVNFLDIQAPQTLDWEYFLNITETLEELLKSEKQSALEVVKTGTEKNDPETISFFTKKAEKLSKQVEVISGLVTALRKAGAPGSGAAEMGEYIKGYIEELYKISW